MKLRMKISILMGSLLLLVFALNLGVASADHPIQTAHDSPGQADMPVGSHASESAFAKGLAFPDGPGTKALGAHNPLCPDNVEHHPDTEIHFP